MGAITIDLNRTRNLASPPRAGCFFAVFMLAGLLATSAAAQTFTTLHSFTATSAYPGPYTNSDGAEPYAGLILSGSTLYGTAQIGGSSGNGTVFKVNTDGTGFTSLHTFTAGSGFFPNFVTNSDGAGPSAGLISDESERVSPGIRNTFIQSLTISAPASSRSEQPGPPFPDYDLLRKPPWAAALEIVTSPQWRPPAGCWASIRIWGRAGVSLILFCANSASFSFSGLSTSTFSFKNWRAAIS
jgi:uncharacterized repeat protein (TIGR03803 family)